MSHDIGLHQTDAEWMELVDRSKALSAGSKLSYKKQLRATARAFHVEGPCSLSEILASPSKYTAEMQKVPDHSLRTYLAALVSLLKRGEEAKLFKRSDPKIAELHATWSELLHTSSKKYHARIDDNRASEREQEGHATVDEWQAVYRAARREDPNSQSTLLLAFHALVFPPLRGGDLAHVRIGYTDEGNCVYRDPEDDRYSVLLIRDHKTSRSYGPLTRVLRGEIVDVMRENVKAHPREWLFVTQGGAAYSDSGFSSWKSNVFHDAFGRPVTTNSLRHAYISSVDRQHQTIREARSLAREMGHGLHTQRQYVRL
jgi:hypothetical protein